MAVPSSSAASFVSQRAMRAITESGTKTPGTSFFMNSALRRLTSGQIPAMMGMRRAAAQPIEEAQKRLGVEHRLRDGELRSRLQLPAEALQLPIQVHRAGIEATPKQNSVGRPTGFCPRSKPRLSMLTRLHSPMASTLNTAVASGYVPMLGGSPGDQEDVADAQRVRAQEVGLQGEEVLVLAGVVGDGLDAGSLLQEDRGRDRAHLDLRARAVGHVHRVDALVLQDAARSPGSSPRRCPWGEPAPRT